MGHTFSGAVYRRTRAAMHPEGQGRAAAATGGLGASRLNGIGTTVLTSTRTSDAGGVDNQFPGALHATNFPKGDATC